MAAKPTTNTRVVKRSVVNSEPFPSSINHDRRSFYQKIAMSTSLSVTRVTNRLIIPLRPVLVQVFLSLFDDWTKKLYTACDAPRNVCKETSSQSVGVC
jgi:hypothetical protein